MILFVGILLFSSVISQTCADDSRDLVDDLVDAYYSVFPHSDDRIDFLLYTKDLGKQFYKLNAKIPNCIQSSPFDNKLPTKIIIHGWMYQYDGLMMSLISAFLKNSKCNVIFVKWTASANPVYPEVTDDIKDVGHQVADMLRNLTKIKGLDLRKVHIVGFSLGAHVAGIAGHALNGAVGRITGLDPAGPLFERGIFTLLFEIGSSHLRLDPTDAKFVDVIHTDTTTLFNTGALGMRKPAGHVDYYVNGGQYQPDCNGPVCSHTRAVELMLEIIKRRRAFPAYRCTSVANAENNACEKEASVYMGEVVDPKIYSSNSKNIFYVRTAYAKPFWKI